MNVSADRKKYFLISFLLGAGIFLLPALSFILKSGLPFIFYGDFNAQQIPFTISLQRNWRNLTLPEYDFNAGTGLDYIGAYGFYNLFSPFTLLMALIPTDAVLYAIPFMIMLKFGFCSMNAYIYASRFCKNNDYAVAGALLYTFSGYQMVNFIFHYLDALVFFPLLLTALEAAVTEKKRGVFGITAAVCAFTNYYIFGIEVIFLIIYFLCRLTDKSFRINLTDFFCLAAESVLGVLAAGLVLFPAVECLLDNPRFSNGFESIKDMLIYETPWRYLRILQSIFIPPDLQGYTNFFPDYKGEYPYGSRWSSQAMYLPLFGMSGVLAYASANKKSWQTKLAAVCIVIAFIPVLNSIFTLGNAAYYARWMFAPTLIMSVMTVCAFENEPKHFRYGLAASVVFVIGLIVFTIIRPMSILALWDDAWVFYSNMQKWVQIAFAVFGIIIAALLIFKAERDSAYSKKILAVTAVFVFAFMETTLLFGIGEEGSPNEKKDAYIYYPTDKMDTEYGSRAVSSDNYCNVNLIFGQKDMYTFNSTVNPYFMEYCSDIGVSKGEISSDYASACLCSAEIMIIGRNEENKIPEEFSEKYKLLEQQTGYSLYENPDFIPIGFCYDNCVSEDDWLTLEENERAKFMLRAMVVEDTKSVSEYLDEISADEIHSLTDEELSAECDKRAEKSAYSFTTDNNSCTAEIVLEKPELVFFSIAYDDNFTAYVDGEQTDIIKANVGFMSVPVPEGNHTVKLVYHSKARMIGAAASITGIAGLAVYTLVLFFKKHRKLDLHKNKD